MRTEIERAIVEFIEAISRHGGKVKGIQIDRRTYDMFVREILPRTTFIDPRASVVPGIRYCAFNNQVEVTPVNEAPKIEEELIDPASGQVYPS